MQITLTGGRRMKSVRRLERCIYLQPRNGRSLYLGSALRHVVGHRPFRPLPGIPTMVHGRMSAKNWRIEPLSSAQGLGTAVQRNETPIRQSSSLHGLILQYTEHHASNVRLLDDSHHHPLYYHLPDHHLESRCPTNKSHNRDCDWPPLRG